MVRSRTATDFLQLQPEFSRINIIVPRARKRRLLLSCPFRLPFQPSYQPFGCVFVGAHPIHRPAAQGAMALAQLLELGPRAAR